MSGKRSENGRKRGGKAKGSGETRVPSILMVPVGLIVGWLAGGPLGAVFGGVVGIFLWRSRA